MTKRLKSETRKSRKARTVPFQKTYDALLQRLIEAREEVGLSQREVSEHMGMAHSYLSKCETGDRRIDLMEFLQLAKPYRESPQFFLED